MRLVSVSVCACTFIFYIDVNIFHSEDITVDCFAHVNRLCANFCVYTFVNIITGVVILHRQDIAVDHCAYVSLLCAVACDYMLVIC